MVNKVSLKDLLDGERARVNDEYVVLSTEASDLEYLLGDSLPNAFQIEGKEKTVWMVYNRTQYTEDNDVEWWSFESNDVVETRDGPRKVALTVFND